MPPFRLTVRAVLLAGAATALVLVGAAIAQERWYPSRYGPADTLGAVNNLSPDGVRRAASLVRQGKVYSLAIPTGPDSPAYDNRRYVVEISPPPGGDTTPNRTGRVTSHDERVTTSMGIGTQLDGLGHLGIDHHYYNGLTGAELNTPQGFKKLDLANMPPIVTRGVVIDMAKHLGVPMLRAGQVFNRSEIEAAAKAQKITIRKGDVVLFHTGWMKTMDTDKALYNQSEPGLGEGGAVWLADLGVVAIGADTIALEPLPPVDPARIFIVHQTLLAKKGVHILENINTAPLVADGVKEFLFVLGQPRFVGTVQVVVNPIAIR
jgi:kynurenine formamidase